MFTLRSPSDNLSHVKFLIRPKTLRNIRIVVYAHSGQKVALKGHSASQHTIGWDFFDF